MRYNVDPRQQAVRDRVKEFAEKEINPVFKDLDRAPEKLPVEYYRKLGKAGLIGFAMPKEYGGEGRSNIEYITLIEELAYRDPATALLAAVPELAVYPIIHFASDEQKKKYLPAAASGEKIPAFALTERMAGSDAANQQTIAKIVGNEFVINGEKIFIMHGDACDFAVLFCRIGDEDEGRPKVSAIIIDADRPGFKGFTLKHKMGMRAATTGRIELKDYKIPVSHQLGEVGKGFRYAMATLDGARIGVAAQGVGIAQRALDEAVSYAKSRIAFGAPIEKLQAIQWMIADMATHLEAARALIDHGAKEVWACSSHAVLSGPAVTRIKESSITRVVTTNTVPMREEAKNTGKISSLSVAQILGEAIRRIHMEDSVSSLFV